MTHPLQSLLYVSRLAAEANASCVSDIIKTARTFNAANGITGVLVFDGERFAQYIEGPPAAIDALTENLKRDRRHTDFTVLHVVQDEGHRQFLNWSMGYSDLDEGQLDIGDLKTQDREKARDLFLARVVLLEIV